MQGAFASKVDFREAFVDLFCLYTSDFEQQEVGPSSGSGLPPVGLPPSSSMVQEAIELVQSDEEGEEM